MKSERKKQKSRERVCEGENHGIQDRMMKMIREKNE